MGLPYLPYIWVVGLGRQSDGSLISCVWAVWVSGIELQDLADSGLGRSSPSVWSDPGDPSDSQDLAQHSTWVNGKHHILLPCRPAFGFGPAHVLANHHSGGLRSELGAASNPEFRWPEIPSRPAELRSAALL